MSKNITQLLKEATKDILTDATLTQIQEAFDASVDSKVQLNVEAALIKQDEDYSAKLETLVETLDADHTTKLERVVEAHDKNNAQKLQIVRNRFSKVVNEQAAQFKEKMINGVSRYLDVYLEKAFPQEMLEEAVANKKATLILGNLRKSLAVGTVLAKESVRDAIIDGKAQLNEALEQLAEANSKLEVITEQAEKAEAALLLEQKISELPEKKKAYAKRVLGDKSAKFITENLEYTMSLFEKENEERRAALKDEAFNGRVAKEDSVIEESVANPVNNPQPNLNPLANQYLQELSKY